MGRRRAALTLVMVSWLIAVSAQAQQPVDYEVQATLNPDDGILEGTLRARIHAEGMDAGDELRFWLYGDRLGAVPSAMNEINARWVFPGGVSHGGVEVFEVQIDGEATEHRIDRRPIGDERGRDFAGADLWVELPSSGEAIREVEIRFRQRLARRFGRLAWVGDRILLAAPWYPLLVGESGGWRFPVPHQVRVRRSDDGMVAVGGALGSGERSWRSTDGFVPVYTSDRLGVFTHEIEGVSVRVLEDGDPYFEPGPDARGLDALRDLARVDRHALILQRVREALLTWRGLQVSGRPDELTVVIGPLRTELTASATDWVVLSDRVYDLVPFDAVQSFHHRSIRRAIFRTWLRRVSAQRDPVRDRVWTDDLRAVVLNDLDGVRRARGVQTTEELIGWAGFHPMVDNLLYAPQIAFVDVFFGQVFEPDPFRDAPDRARLAIARGRRLLEAARDNLSEERFRVFAAALLREEESAAGLIEAAVEEGRERLSEWLRTPRDRLNYRLGEVEQQALGEGRFVYRVEVFRDGAQRVEPVELLAVDEEGGQHRGSWDGRGEHTTISIEGDAPLSHVILDPRGRLIQSPEVADGHPRRDDRTRLPWRPPLMQAMTFSTNPLTGRVRALVDFAMRRRYDLEQAFAASLSTDERGTGAYVRYIRGVGPKLTTNRRVGFVAAGGFASRLHAGFSGDAEAAWRYGISIAGGLGSQRYILDPRGGVLATATLRAAMTRTDSGAETFTIGAAARFNQTVGFGTQHAMVFVLDSAWVWGQPVDNERPSLGGPAHLRSLPPGQSLGDGRLLGVVEYRFTAVPDLRWNLLSGAWARELQWVAFGGFGALWDGPIGTAPTMAGEIGTGLRLHMEYLGLLPGLFAVDVAFPIYRSEGAPRPGPFNLRIGFGQFF